MLAERLTLEILNPTKFRTEPKYKTKYNRKIPVCNSKTGIQIQLNQNAATEFSSRRLNTSVNRATVSMIPMTMR